MKVAVVGATGLVGGEILKVLAERNFPVSEIIPVASERSIGKKISFKGKEFAVVGYETAIAMKPNVAIFSAGGALPWKWHLNLLQQALRWWIIHRRGVWTQQRN